VPGRRHSQTPHNQIHNRLTTLCSVAIIGFMNRFVKASIIIIIAVVLLACFVVFRSRPAEPAAVTISDSSPGPSFEVRVGVPRLGRPFAGILPDWLVGKFDLTPGELRFDSKSLGAQIGIVGHDRVELRADGWDLSIKTDGEGRVAPDTRLVFRLALGGRQVRLNCRPADPSIGDLSIATRGPDQLAGRFLVEFASCKNAESGKAIEWPPAPLTVRGSFVSAPKGNP
jgi:hypothetical protein